MPPAHSKPLAAGAAAAVGAAAASKAIGSEPDEVEESTEVDESGESKTPKPAPYAASIDDDIEAELEAPPILEDEIDELEALPASPTEAAPEPLPELDEPISIDSEPEPEPAVLKKSLEPPVAEFDDDELVVDLDDELDDLEEFERVPKPAIPKSIDPSIAAIDDLDDVEVPTLPTEAPAAAVTESIASIDDKTDPLGIAPVDNLDDNDFEMPEPEFPAEETSEAAEDESTATETDDDIVPVDDVDSAEDEEDADGKKTGGIFKFRPIELLGLAAVLVACAVGLFMLTSNVSGILDEASKDYIPIADTPPTELEGAAVQIGAIDCYWRDRQDGDRTDELSIILPVVTLAEPSGAGTVQVLFYDAKGEIRGDGHTFRVSGGSFDVGPEAIALCTEGLKNEAEFAYYRSDGELAKRDRWSVRIRESADGNEWSELARFEFPTERR